MTLLRPKEILENNPRIRKHFNEAQLGALHWLGFVRGRKLRRGSEICLEDVQRMVEFKNKIA